MRKNRRLSAILILLVVAATVEPKKLCKPITTERGRVTHVCHNLFTDRDLGDVVSSIIPNSITKLNISDSSLLELNSNIFKEVNLTSLKIEANVQIIRGHTFENSSIAEITLDNNQIQEIESYSFNSSGLRSISLYNNSLKKILEKQFAGVYELNELHLGTNKIVDIQPHAFKDLRSLNTLDLSHNLLSYLPPNIFRTLEYLFEVNLNDNNFEKLPTDLFLKNPHLKILRVENNYLSSFDGTKFPKSLSIILLKNNCLTSFNISNLTNLQLLHLGNNKLVNIDESFLHSNDLHSLSLSSNYLGPFLSDKSFRGLQNIMFLDLSTNNISKFNFELITRSKGTNSENNDTFVDFSNIKILNLRNNSISDIKNVSLLKNLESLYLHYNEIDQVAYDMFGELNKLRKLSLKHNMIKKFHIGCFRDLKSLVELDLSYNKLDSIPSSIFNGMLNLERLDLSYNNITALDEGIFHSNQRLKFLNISNNYISNITVRRITSYVTWLREINVIGNNLSCKDLIGILNVRGTIDIHGSSFNITNVNGIPCNESDDFEKLEQVCYNRNVFNMVNVLLFAVLFIFSFKVIHEKCSQKIRVVKQFNYQKTTTELELNVSF